MSEKKSITKNYIYNLIYQMLIIVLPLITTPYLSQTLGAENIGIYGFTLSTVTYFILFGSLGVAMYGKREVAYNQENIKERSKVFWEILIMRFITLGIALLAFYVTFCIKGDYSTYYKILILELLASCIDISWFFQGLEEFKKTVSRNIIVKIISVIMIFTLVKTKSDLLIYFFIYVLSNFLGNLSLWLYLPKFIEKVKFKELKIFKHLKPTISLFIPQIAIQVYTVLDKTMIGNILGDMSEVGYYEQSQKMLKMLLLAVTALGAVTSSRIASIASNNNNEEVKGYLENSFRFVWFLGMPIMLGVMAISRDFVPWFFGIEFEKAKTILFIGAPIVIAIGLSNVSGEQYLVSVKKQKYYTISVIVGAIFNVIANFILIPIFKSIGAMIASVLSEFLVLAVQLICIKKYIPLKIVYKDCFKYIMSGVIMFAVVFGIGFLLEPVMITTIIQILVGVVVYGLMLIFLKDKMLYGTLKKYLNKIL